MNERRCKECDQPTLPKGQKREHPEEYRHARGCPHASKSERESTERAWAQIEPENKP